MDEFLATLLVAAATVYLGVGIVFAVAFVLTGVTRIDSAARGSTVGFRILIIPGCAAFWPVLALRWARGQEPPEERTPHRQLARQERNR